MRIDGEVIDNDRKINEMEKKSGGKERKMGE